MLGDRFWSKVNKTAGCWEWMAMVENCGYGQYYITQHKRGKAHRVLYESIHGAIKDPKGVVMHKCDNRKCVNPEHLVLGTRKLNNEDRDNKGRQVTPLGESHGQSILSAADVLGIRKDRKNGMTGVAVAEKYSIHTSTVSQIYTRKTWKHV